MNWSGWSVMLALVCISTLAWLINNWIRVKYGYPLISDVVSSSERQQADLNRGVDLLVENALSHLGRIEKLEQRVLVLERIVNNGDQGTGESIKMS